MRPRIDFAAGRFIHPARLHADEAVLDEVETPDAMLAAKVVERRQQSGGRNRLPVQRDAVAALEIDYAIFGGVGRILGVGIGRAVCMALGCYVRRILVGCGSLKKKTIRQKY